jgi:hypothetical protein
MNGAEISWILLAQATRLEQMGRGMRLSQSRVTLFDLWPLALTFLTLIVAITAYNSWRRYHDYRERCDDPQKLFRELCAMHKLDRAQRRLLEALVQTVGFEQPAQVFLAPSVFGRQLPPTLNKKAAQYQTLSSQLFAR